MPSRHMCAYATKIPFSVIVLVNFASSWLAMSAARVSCFGIVFIAFRVEVIGSS